MEEGHSVVLLYNNMTTVFFTVPTITVKPIQRHNKPTVTDNKTAAQVLYR